MADIVELIVSELVTNAVQASMGRSDRPRYSGNGGLACVRVRLSSDHVMTLVEVWDENAGLLPAPAQTASDDESGRGLMLVAALSQKWGWDVSSQGRGKVVWALVASTNQ